MSTATRSGYVALLCAPPPCLASGAAFGVPADQLKKSKVMPPQCSYKMKGNGKTEKVKLSVRAHDTDKDAAGHFQNYTPLPINVFGSNSSPSRKMA